MDFQDTFPPVDIRQSHNDLPVEAPGAHQRRVQRVRPIRGRDHDQSALVGKPVHLHQKRVKRLLPLVVAAADAGKAQPSHGIDLIDKNNSAFPGTHGSLASLLEEIPHARGPHSDEHFDEIRSAQRKKRHVGLSGDRFGQ